MRAALLGAKLCNHMAELLTIEAQMLERCARQHEDFAINLLDLCPTREEAEVLLLTPSQAVFDELLALGQQKHGAIFGNLIDCTEQGLLNTYFNGAPGREVTKLPIGRADDKADWTAAAAPFAVHWITHVCPVSYTHLTLPTNREV